VRLLPLLLIAACGSSSEPAAPTIDDEVADYACNQALIPAAKATDELPTQLRRADPAKIKIAADLAAAAVPPCEHASPELRQRALALRDALRAAERLRPVRAPTTPAPTPAPTEPAPEPAPMVNPGQVP
jgi:hypothetical protein